MHVGRNMAPNKQYVLVIGRGVDPFFGWEGGGGQK